MDIVIGSGPSGLAVALARIAMGNEVIVLDGGKTLAEPAVNETPARAEWMAPQFEASPGQVRRYGSDFAMEPAEATFAVPGRTALRASRAVGGLSNLWGAAMRPWHEADLAGWPVSIADLAPSWRALSEVVPHGAAAEGPQIGTLLGRLARREGPMRELGVSAEPATVAVAPGCRLCGLCLHGCPWGLIWSARRTIEALVRARQIAHLPGGVVRAVSEDGDGANAHLADGTTVSGERVFIAAGALETARILIASAQVPAELSLRESQFAFLPMLHRWRSDRRPDAEPLNTLPQAFVAIEDPALSPFALHAQLYGWNEFYGRDLRANYGKHLPLAGPVLDRLARHLIVAQLFLHSDHGGSIALRLARDGRLLPEARPNPQTDPVARGGLRRLGAAMRLGGLSPLRFAARLAEPGASFHVGASLPMRAKPGPGESDTLGRPRGAARIHVVDASVLPAIPASTITWGVMGNAHRIGLCA